MLFVNIDLILELLNTNYLKKNSENKLKYYDLVDDIELDMNRMVNKLWK